MSTEVIDIQQNILTYSYKICVFNFIYINFVHINHETPYITIVCETQCMYTFIRKQHITISCELRVIHFILNCQKKSQILKWDWKMFNGWEKDIEGTKIHDIKLATELSKNELKFGIQLIHVHIREYCKILTDHKINYKRVKYCYSWPCSSFGHDLKFCSLQCNPYYLLTPNAFIII